MQHPLVLFADGETGPGRSAQIIPDLFSIQLTVYSGKIGAARTSLARLPTISSSCLIQIVPLRRDGPAPARDVPGSAYPDAVDKAAV